MDTNFDKKNFIKIFKHDCNRVQTKKFIKGETVTTYIEKRNQICIVLSGEVDLIRYDFNGNKISKEEYNKLCNIYNGEKGKLNWMKWFLYLYYPLHLIIIGILRITIYGNIPLLFN